MELSRLLRPDRAGSCVAVLSNNRPELVPLFWEVVRRGYVWAPLNAHLTPAELRPLVERLRPRVVLVEEALRERLGEGTVLEGIDVPAASPVDLPGDRIVATLFTSGTTGRAKAAQLSFGNFAASARGTAKNLNEPALASQRWLLCLPHFHVAGLAMITRCGLFGARLDVHASFDPERANAAIDDGVTHVSLVATALARLLEARRERFPETLRAILVGGGPVSPDLLARAKERGARVLQTYGLTEACSQVATERPTDADGTTAGPPIDGVEVRIVGADGTDLPRGEVGEIEVRGPTVMRGYLDDPAATAAAIRHGWLRTGDLGHLDARGRLVVHARRHDLIVTGGENVYPAEVEAALCAHPDVCEAAVVPISDERWGQRVLALVVVRRPVGAEALERSLRERLASFKVPKSFLFVPGLPRLPVGKLDRAAARAMAERWARTVRR